MIYLRDCWVVLIQEREEAHSSLAPFPLPQCQGRVPLRSGHPFNRCCINGFSQTVGQLQGPPCLSWEYQGSGVESEHNPNRMYVIPTISTSFRLASCPLSSLFQLSSSQAVFSEPSSLRLNPHKWALALTGFFAPEIQPGQRASNYDWLKYQESGLVITFFGPGLIDSYKVFSASLYILYHNFFIFWT